MAQAEQYFAAEPQSKDVRKTLHVTLRGNEADVEVSNGVFSGNRVDLGTSVLLRQAPEPPEEGTFLDLGCGWGQSRWRWVSLRRRRTSGRWTSMSARSN